MKTPALLGPDGKTALRDYAGYHGGAGGFGGQLRARNPPSESADAALLPNFSRGNARADDLVRNNGYAANAVQLHQITLSGRFSDSVIGPAGVFWALGRKRPGRSPVKLRRHGKNLRRTIAAALMRNVSVHSP